MAGCDTSGADLLEDEVNKKQEMTDISDEWDWSVSNVFNEHNKTLVIKRKIY